MEVGLVEAEEEGHQFRGSLGNLLNKKLNES